jgi:hypothetical protein
MQSNVLVKALASTAPQPSFCERDDHVVELTAGTAGKLDPNDAVPLCGMYPFTIGSSI